MVNLLISMNFILLTFLIYNEKTYCLMNSFNSDIDNLSKDLTQNEITNTILNQNKVSENLLINNYFKKKQIKEINQIDINDKYENKNVNNEKKRIFINEDINIKKTLKLDYLNSTSIFQFDQFSFIENDLNIQESEFFSFKKQPFKWTNVSISGKIPSPRKDYSVILADSYLIFFGGCTQDNDFYNDLFFYDILGETFLEVMQKGKIPSARCGHIAKLYGSVMWMYGGYSREGYLNDLFSLNLESVIQLYFYYLSIS